MSVNRVSRLFQACRLHTASPQAIAALSQANNASNFAYFQPVLDALGEVTPEDVGGANLERLMHPGKISVTTIYNSEQLWLGLFGLSKGTGFPIHDHPSMNGFVKLLTGKLRLRSLNEVSRQAGSISVKLVAEKEADGPAVLAVGPERNNFHDIWAVTPCLIFQVFIPNYNRQRLCTFYKVARQEGSLCHLHSEPATLESVDLPYQGLPAQ